MTYEEFLENLRTKLQSEMEAPEAENQFGLFVQLLNELDPNKDWEKKFSLESLGLRLKLSKLELKWSKLVKIFNKKHTVIVDENYITRKVLNGKTRKYEFLIFRKKDIDGKEIRREKVVLMKDEIFKFISEGWEKEDSLKKIAESLSQHLQSEILKDVSAEMHDTDFDKTDDDRKREFHEESYEEFVKERTNRKWVVYETIAKRKILLKIDKTMPRATIKSN